jgi:KDO2-lipid IV(A) lauroyltransferase
MAIFGALLFPLAALPARAHLFLGSVFGRLFFLAAGRRRKIAVGNIERCQEAGALSRDLDPKAVARDSFTSVARTILESLAFSRRGMAYYKGRYSFAGGEHIERALELAGPGKRGIVLLTAHTANWELCPQAILETYGLSMAIVGRSQGSALVDALIERARTQTGNGFLYKDDAARAMLRILKGGGAIGTLYDQAAIVEREGAVLEFMGRPAHTNLGPVKLAARTGAVLLAAFASREGGRHLISFQPPLVPPEGAGQAWILETAQALNDLLGRHVASRPGEWMWGHRRWKTPGGIREDPLSF